ncbi:hypothetical protein LXL04_007998 [Taraxacum kok-saghyz]
MRTSESHPKFPKALFDTQKQKAFTDYCGEPVLFVPSNKLGTEGTPRDPLLVSSKEDQNGFAYINKTSPLLKSTKWVLKSAMWLIFISWFSFLFLVPSDSVKQLYTKLVHATSGTPFGNTGSIFLIYSGPVLIIPFLAIIYPGICGEDETPPKRIQPRLL